MLPLRGIACHIVMGSIIPSYVGVRWLLNPSYFRTTSPVWLVMAGLAWSLVLVRVNIPFFTSPLHHLPRPKNDSLLWGNVSIMTEQPPTNCVLDVCNETPNDGLILVWGLLWLRPNIIPTAPDTLMEVLNAHSYDWEKPRLAKVMLERVLGQGLVNVEGHTHKGMRKSVAPAFSGRHIRDLVPLFWQKGLANAEAMARQVRSSADGALEMMAQMSRVTLDIIGAAGVGKDFNTIENDDDILARLYETITASDRGPPIIFFLLNVLVPQWVLRKLRGTIYARVANATLTLRQSIRDLLADKKRDLEMSKEQQKDIIAIIMRSGNFDDDYLASQLLTFLAAGHDTTASALTWTTWLLSINPEIQDRLRKECQEHLSGVPFEDVDADVFDRMPYLTACCNETFRLYPTVPITARHAVVETRIRDVVMPKGTQVFVSPWAVNRLSSLWGADANKYRPERWIEGPLAATGGARSTHSLVTFLHGPRSCIGQSFARSEMRCILAAFVLRFRLEMADPNAKVETGGFVTIKPKHGLRLKLHDLKSS